MSVSVGVECDRELADELASELGALAEGRLISAAVDCLDGTPETILHLFRVAPANLSALTPVLVGRMRKIRLEELDVECGSRADVGALIEAAAKKSA